MNEKIIQIDITGFSVDSLYNLRKALVAESEAVALDFKKINTPATRTELKIRSWDLVSAISKLNVAIIDASKEQLAANH